MNTKYSLKFAFTLAEILITLGVIGILAALVIPNLIGKYKDYQFKVAYKKAFSIASQAVVRANVDKAYPIQTYNQNNNIYFDYFDVFMSYFSTQKVCINNNNKDCWDIDGEKSSATYPTVNAHAFIDNSGVAWSMAADFSPGLYVDTNGFKPPNKWGKDRFALKTNEATIHTTALLHEMILTPQRIKPVDDNPSSLCYGTNECASKQDYYGTSWLYK